MDKLTDDYNGGGSEMSHCIRAADSALSVWLGANSSPLRQSQAASSAAAVVAASWKNSVEAAAALIPAAAPPLVV